MRFQLRTRVPQPEAAQALALSPDGRLVAATCFDQKMRVYDGRSLALRKTLHLGTAFPHAACFSPDGARVASGGKALTLFDTASWKKLVTLKGHRHEIQDACFSPDGARAYTASGNGYTPADWSVRAWDAATGAELWRWKARSQVFALAPSPDGKTLVAGDSEGRAAALDAATGAARWYVDVAGWIYRLRYTPSGDAVVASGEADSLALIDPADGAHRTLPTGAAARAFDLTRDGKTAVVGRASQGVLGNLLTVDLATGTHLWQSEPFGYLPQGLELSPDGRTLYVLLYSPHELLVFDRDD